LKRARLGRSFAIALVLTSGLGAQASAENSGALTVRVINGYGNDVPSGWLTVTAGDGAIAHEGLFSNLETFRLRYGDYTIKFVSQFFHPPPRTVEIKASEQTVVIAAEMDPLEASPNQDVFSMSLRLSPPVSCSTGRFLWAKVVGVFFDYSEDRRVGPNGFSLFEPLRPGKYVVIVSDSGDLRAVKEFSTTSPITTLNVDLVPCKNK